MSNDVWESVQPLLPRVARPSRYVDGEWGAVRKPEDVAYRVALAYPDTYELGMANQALAILYARLNALPGVAAERLFVPWTDMAALMREHAIPLFTLESFSDVGRADMLGITLPYELTYTNVLELLDLARIPLRSADRSEEHPLVVGGGPCAFNPEPVAPFFDAILIGEGEGAAEEIVEAHRTARAKGESRSDVLRSLSRVPGVYVPGLYEPDGKGGVKAVAGAPERVAKRVVADLGEVTPPTCPVVPYMDVTHDRFALEILRGCTRGCRFCQAGVIYRPVRERTSDDIVRRVMEGLACTGYEEVSLTSLSSADHSQLADVLRRLRHRLEGTATSISLPSLRVDAFSLEMARLSAAGSKKAGLTFAPEAGTQRLRDVINKNVTEEDVLDTVRRAFEAGWRRLKLYFMIGLPTETDDDVRGIGELVRRVMDTARAATPPEQRGGVKLSVSVSTFVPKAHTPFQWEGQLTADEIERRQEVLRSSVPRKGVDLAWHDRDTTLLEGALARGGRQTADVVEAAWRRGQAFAAWTEEFDMPAWLDAFDDAGVTPEDALGAREPGSPTPWSHIDCGVSEPFLLKERERAYQGVTTKDCSFSGCVGCDVCQTLGVDVVVGGRRG